jgi:flagella basal body P-ring formation protein FlgA
MRLIKLIALTGLPVLVASATCASANEAVRTEQKEQALAGEQSGRMDDAGTAVAANDDPSGNTALQPVRKPPAMRVIHRTNHAEIDRAPHSLLRRIAHPTVSTVSNGQESLTLPDAPQSLQGAATSPTTQRLTGAAISAAAQRHLVEELGRQFAGVEAISVAPLPDIDVPIGQVLLRPRPLNDVHAGSSQPVWIDVLVDGVFSRSVRVPFQVRLQERVQVAIRDLPAGTLVSSKDFEARTMDVSNLGRRMLPPIEMQGTMRVRARIGAGEAVQPHQLIDETTLQRGDVVKLVLAAGGVIVETRAVAQQPAVLGQEVKVKPDHSMESVSGRVVAAGVVRADTW